MAVINVNGKKSEIKSETTLSSYLNSLAINLNAVIVEFNFEIPDRSKWKKIILNDGDNIEIVKFIGGG